MVLITPEIISFDKKVTSLSASYKSRATPNNFYFSQQKILSKDRGKDFSSIKDLREIGILGFSYNSREKDYSNIISELREQHVPRGKFKELYKDKIKESTNKLNMLESLGTLDFSDKSRKVYGYPDKILINKAYDLLDLKPNEKSESFNTQKAKKLLSEKLKEMDLDWKINTKKLLGYALITPLKKTVTLSSNHVFTESTINRLAVHEVGTHGVRYLNGKLQPLKIFKNFPGYIETEEGLASFTEELTGFLNNNTLRRYAGRVVAVEYAQNHDLFETYVFLRNYFDRSNALHIAMRVKRGLPNSDSVGAFTKDYVYLKGFLDVKNYMKKNPLKLLYFGKVNMNYVSLIKKLEAELTPIKYFPPFLTDFQKKSEVFD